MRLARWITAANRSEIAKIVDHLPAGAWIEIIDEQRSRHQNRLMWSMLRRVSEQVEHCGRHYDPAAWKDIFMHALGKEGEFVPALDGESVLALGYRSSRLTKEEMSELIELIASWGVQHGVDFG